MQTVELGKIEHISFGRGGYQDAQFGLTVTLSGAAWGVGDFHGDWDYNIVPDENHKWTEDDRSRNMAALCRYISGLLRAAKVGRIDQLRGVPIEATFDGGTLTSWRILTEVL